MKFLLCHRIVAPKYCVQFLLKNRKLVNDTLLTGRLNIIFRLEIKKRWSICYCEQNALECKIQLRIKVRQRDF